MPSVVVRLAVVFIILPFMTSMAWAQVPGVGAGENEWSENAKTPFRVKLSGIINTQPEEATLQTGEANLGLATLRVGAFNETRHVSHHVGLEILQFHDPEVGFQSREWIVADLRSSG